MNTLIRCSRLLNCFLGAGKIKRFASRLFDRSWKKSPGYLLSRCMISRGVQVVQIGSNDGETNDPLRTLLLSRRSWRALLVEPVPYLFDRLTRNYPRDPRFAFENVAITNDESAVFHWVDASAKDHVSNLPPWFDQLGSFERGHITKHLHGILEPFIVSSPVRCMTLSQLLDHHGIRHLGILHIDTEGHDWHILSQLDLNVHEPDVILFEHRHLNPIDKQSSLRFLADRYEIYDLGRDYLAIAQKTTAVRRAPLSILAAQRIEPIPAG